MEPMTRCDINLFADTMPSLDTIDKLSKFVNASESNQLNFARDVAEQLDSAKAQNQTGIGIGLYLLGRYTEAIEELDKAKDSAEKFMYLAKAYFKRRKFDDSIAALDKALKLNADKFRISMMKAETFRMAGDLDAAEKEIASCSNFENVNADYHYQLGRLQEAKALYSKALKSYQKAIELNPEHQLSYFRIAFRCDLRGDEEGAIDYYKQVISINPIHVNALLNLAVVYEDTGRFDKAARCIETVVQSFPNHKRAQLFKKDIESSKTMFIDEEKEKRKSRKNQILETPISDFELSVRSRNCLKKMRINTLGDLLNITEAELLSYKNFGETSLREIKGILEPRNLHLGQALDDKPITMVAYTAPDVDDSTDGMDQELLGKPLDELNLSVRSRKCLQKLNVRTIGDIVRKTEPELLGCKNFGVTSLNEIKRALTVAGLGLRTID